MNDREALERAPEIARALLSSLPQRWRHTQGVAERAAHVAPALHRDDRDLLVAAAWLHDIGYSPKILDTGFHPLDGARYLQRRGFPRQLVCLVAHHSGAAYDAEERQLDGELAEFQQPDGPVLDALIYADMMTSPRGRPISFIDRLAEGLRRHGKDSIYSRIMPRRFPYLAAAIVRTQRRLATAAADLPPEAAVHAR